MCKYDSIPLILRKLVRPLQMQALERMKAIRLNSIFNEILYSRKI